MSGLVLYTNLSSKHYKKQSKIVIVDVDIDLVSEVPASSCLVMTSFVIMNNPVVKECLQLDFAFFVLPMLHFSSTTTASKNASYLSWCLPKHYLRRLRIGFALICALSLRNRLCFAATGHHWNSGDLEEDWLDLPAVKSKCLQPWVGLP